MKPAPGQAVRCALQLTMRVPRSSSLSALIIIAEMIVLNVAGYLIEERRRWPVGTTFQINSEF